MFIMTAKFPKKRLLAILLLAAAAILLPFLLPDGEQPEGIPGGSEAERVAYLSSLGWEVDEQPIETLTVRLPQPLSEPYLSYNELQKTQGFDLSTLGDATLERFTYTVRNHPADRACQANLYVYEGEIVAGDIVCTGENGFLSDLKFPEKQ